MGLMKEAVAMWQTWGDSRVKIDAPELTSHCHLVMCHRDIEIVTFCHPHTGLYLMIDLI
jgi:hypothetical protein